MLWEQPLKGWKLAVGTIRFASEKDSSGHRVEGGWKDPQGERATSEQAAVMTGGGLSAEHTGQRRGEREWRGVWPDGRLQSVEASCARRQTHTHYISEASPNLQEHPGSAFLLLLSPGELCLCWQG